MDDQRDYEEERAQEAALREEQEAEFELQDEIVAGLEDLGNTDPVDSSSEEYVPDIEVEAEEDTEQGEEGGVMLWQAGADNLLDTLKDILAFAKFATRHANLTRRLIDAGAPADAGKITVEIDALDAQALSVGLNFVGFFVPELGDSAEDLLRRIADERLKWEPTEEQDAAFKKASQQVDDEDTASMLGFETVEQYRAAKEQALADYEAAQVAEADATIRAQDGEPHLN